MTTTRIPPNNVEMESAILGAILLDNGALPRVIELLDNGADFYKPANRKVYEAMLSLFENNQPIDIMTVAENLKTKGWLKNSGGVDYLAELLDAVPTALNAGMHSKVVRDKAMLRQLITATSEGTGLAYAPTDDAGAVMDAVEALIMNVSMKRVKNGAVRIRDGLKPAMKKVEVLYDQKSFITGATTGYKDLDVKTAGLQKSDLVIIAGRPSMGKTAFALNIVQNFTAVEPEAVVAVFSLEMSTEQLILRLLCSEAGVSLQKLRTGFMAQSDWPKLSMAAGKLYKRNIFIDDAAGQTALEIRAKTRRILAEQRRLDMVVIDYLGLMSNQHYMENQVQALGEITKSMKNLAKEIDAPVVLLSQLSRRCEQRDDKRPQLSDLRDSGRIEEDADVVMFVYREEFYKPDKPDVQGLGEIIIGKQRSGPTGTVKLTFRKEFTRFENHTEGGYGY